MPKTKFSKSELLSISRLLHEHRALPLKRVMIYPNFGLYTPNKNLWDMHLFGNDKIVWISFITKNDIKELKLIEQLLKYFGEDNEKDKS